MAQFPFFTPLASSLWIPLPFPFTYFETLLWRDAILSTLAPGCSQTDLPLTIASPFPPIPNSQCLRSIVRLTKTTSRSRLLMVRNSILPWSRTLSVNYIIIVTCFYNSKSASAVASIPQPLIFLSMMCVMWDQLEMQHYESFSQKKLRQLFWKAFICSCLFLFVFCNSAVGTMIYFATEPP